MPTVKIAIDGPAGAGKSTISKMVAGKLSFIYIDTGAMYRAVALFALRHGLHTNDSAGVGLILNEIEIDIKHDNQGFQRVILCGEDVTDEIRTPQMSMAASNVSAIPAVRIKLVELQRNLADTYNCVMDGRDIGTYVLPNAQIKIFLTANVEDRAKRRYDEMCAKGQDCSLEQILQDMKQRDFNDSTREFAPLKKADDAIEVNTTGYTLEQSFNSVYLLIKERLGR